jgi:hypothetical protein
VNTAKRAAAFLTFTAMAARTALSWASPARLLANRWLKTSRLAGAFCRTISASLTADPRLCLEGGPWRPAGRYLAALGLSGLPVHDCRKAGFTQPGGQVLGQGQAMALWHLYIYRGLLRGRDEPGHGVHRAGRGEVGCEKVCKFKQRIKQKHEQQAEPTRTKAPRRR